MKYEVNNHSLIIPCNTRQQRLSWKFCFTVYGTLKHLASTHFL